MKPVPTTSSPSFLPSIPVEVVFAPDWWFHHSGITFDRDFFFNPNRRVEVEKQMEHVLYERFGDFGLGEKRAENRPEIGAVHLAAGFLVSEMLGCTVEYHEDAPPSVKTAGAERSATVENHPFQTSAWKQVESLMEALETRYGYLTGDINWGGVLNVALDIRGQDLFVDMSDTPEEVSAFFGDIAQTLDEFSSRIQARTGSSSISVNRIVKHLPLPIHLHSECSHTMISEEQYRQFLMPFDKKWSQSRRPYGIHYCGRDPHRFAQSFGELPRLDFLDLGWGGDVALLRKHLPKTFFSIRLDPVSLCHKSPSEIRQIIQNLIHESAIPDLTGICCINMDKNMPDENIRAMFEAARI